MDSSVMKAGASHAFHDSWNRVMKVNPKLNENGDQSSVGLIQKLRDLKSRGSQPTMYKVHDLLRNVNSDAYEPKLIAIGPYHRHNENLNKAEKLKLLFLQRFLDRTHKTAEDFLSTIRSREAEARGCYDEPIHLNPIQFAEMLVLDGCFILEFALQWSCGWLRDNYLAPCIASSITRDLMLFENQIPYFVIRELSKWIIIGQNKHEYPDLAFILLNLFTGHIPVMDRFPVNGAASGDGDVKHLLELIYINLIPKFPYSTSSHVSESTEAQNVAEKTMCIEVSSCCKLFPFSAKAVGIPYTRYSIDPNSHTPYMISCATILHDFNVKFEKRDPQDSMFEMRFENGTMLLPCFRIADPTESSLRNLIAYEQYFQGYQRCYMVDFIALFDCLINSAEDVKLLAKSGIIDNWLGSEEAVAEMFNKLVHNVTMSAGDHFTYEEDFQKVKEHCEIKWHAWMAKLKRNHFNSPWTIISIVAALILLILTLLQTVFTIIN